MTIFKKLFSVSLFFILICSCSDDSPYPYTLEFDHFEMSQQTWFVVGPDRQPIEGNAMHRLSDDFENYIIDGEYLEVLREAGFLESLNFIDDNNYNYTIRTNGGLEQYEVGGESIDVDILEQYEFNYLSNRTTDKFEFTHELAQYIRTDGSIVNSHKFAEHESAVQTYFIKLEGLAISPGDTLLVAFPKAVYLRR